jgi:hypothetical protein
MPFPENDQQIVTHETAPPDITLEIVSPKLYTAKLICILKIVYIDIFNLRIIIYNLKFQVRQ